ncbi:hypothetical protein IFR08_19365 [Pseudomonas fluorescens]|uniref:Colicin immunity protein n=2 Tax=Pseudomonas fluorescens TaxID=294 RepID=A0A2N1E7P2_PSEFL|nr:colicin E1 family microcin immunity protein [Pseudomonas fluorescens]MBD8098091.1 hypothetical protein [Pseudomonas fluorescens]MBD8775890.1 hypothetical protein [Pseudomonas fluorescens]MBD8779111.1 hypothetical protein [Pseudomonas fluorescens]MBD8795641.1 hypothetical protein [Pseudomonas fluorescens]PKH21516.1 colicin immunity protein [Pseudomonas fluorescens]
MISIFIFVLFFTDIFGESTFLKDISFTALMLGAGSIFLFPFSRFIIEQTALRFTRREFWTTGLLTESSGKNGLYVIFYMVCIAFAIPAVLGYLFYSALKKVA